MDKWTEHASCRHYNLDYWFPTLGDPDNHGTYAKDICRQCPVREPCLTNAIATKEDFGISGGAGEDERRWLRRAWNQDGPDGPVWGLAVDRHFAGLDGERLPVVNRNGPHAVCGKGVTYSRGCRCPACELRASWRGAGAKLDKARRVA